MTKITADWLLSTPARQVLELLEAGGFQALFVGGCVRNALLDAQASDIDIATDALPAQVMELAASQGMKAVPTGIDHGTVTLVIDGTGFEVTTFRRDVETDGRRAVVAFSDKISDDARRRDFTMNALYARKDGALVDPLGGLGDLRARRVRFIEDASQRIREDYLRILRFFRFHAWFGSDGLDPDGLAACAAHADGIDSLSAERIGQEMLKLLAAPDPAPAVAAMAASGVLMRILPGANATALAPLVHVEDLADLSPDPLRRLAVLAGPADTLARLRLSKAQSERVAALGVDEDRPGVLGYLYGPEVARDVLAVQAAMFGRPIDTTAFDQIDAGSAQVFPLKAADLMPKHTGKELGEVLKTAKRRWLDSDFALTKDDLIA